jgi:predicted signal transduction protein with EAL and GGDEF domain
MTQAVQTSVGAALFPDHGTDPESLLKRADVAMYAAKAARSGCELYDAQLDEGSPEHLALAGDLGRAIARDELVVHYQPKIDLRTDAVAGVEGLVRWQHPRLGVVSPARFVRVAERSGHIRPLTRHVLRRALADCRRWRDEGFEVSVAVNLATEHLLDPALPGEVATALADAGLDAGLLELEVTEGSLAAGAERAGEVIGRLRALGVVVLLDDFGGSSSLRSLRDLPVDGIKIDASFVTGVGEDTRDAMIVRSAIELGHNLGLQVVAEGVESEDVRRELQRLGCDLAQGYHLGPPMTPSALTAWMARRVSSAPIREV